MHHLSQSSSSALRRAAAKAAKPTLARGAHKEIKFSNDGRAAILRGVDVLADAVSVTLGPKGQSPLRAFTIMRADSVCRSQRHHRAVLWRPQDHKRCVSLRLSTACPDLAADGVTVAKSIQLKDKFENLGAR